MKNYNRRRQILEVLGEKGHLSVQELAQRTEVSLPTIRRDLIELEKQGMVTREHGIVLLRGISADTMYVQREKHNLELKKQIAKEAASDIKEGETIALDIGTTCVEIAKELTNRNNITVFTSSVQAAAILARSSLSIYLIGGFLRNAQLGTIGSIAIDTVLKFKFDRFFMNLAGISNEDGPTDYNLEETEVKRAFISRSREVVAVIDKSKLNKSALVKVCELDDIDSIITNGGEFAASDFTFGDKMRLV